MSLYIVWRAVSASIFGPPPNCMGEGGSAACDPFALAKEKAAQNFARAEKVSSVVRRDGDRAPRKTHRGVGVADQAGQPASVDHDMATCCACGALFYIGGDHTCGLGFEGYERSPWNPWEGGL